MDIGSPRTISTRSLPGARINVDVSFLGDFSGFLLIIFRERFQRIKEDVFGFFVGVFLIGVGENDRRNDAFPSEGISSLIRNISLRKRYP